MIFLSYYRKESPKIVVFLAILFKVKFKSQIPLGLYVALSDSYMKMCDFLWAGVALANRNKH